MKVSPYTPSTVLPMQETLFPTLTNHQGWKIELQPNGFHLKNLFGIEYTTDLCIIENGQMSDEGVKERFTNASPREVHVETHKGQTYVRFSPYGLAGGAPPEDDKELSLWDQPDTGTVVYLGLAATGAYGVYKIGAGKTVEDQVKGAVALGACISGIASRSKGDSALQFIGKVALGAGLGAASGTASSYVPEILGEGLKNQVYGQALIGAGSGAVATVGRKIIDEQNLPSLREIGKGAAMSALSAGMGTLAAAGVHEFIPASAEEGFIPAVTRVAKEAIKNGTGASTGVVSVNAVDYVMTEEEKREWQSIFKGVPETFVTSAGIGALISGAKEIERGCSLDSIQRAEDRVKKSEKELERAKKTIEEKAAEVEKAKQKKQAYKEELLKSKSPEECERIFEMDAENERLIEVMKRLEELSYSDPEFAKLRTEQELINQRMDKQKEIADSNEDWYTSLFLGENYWIGRAEARLIGAERQHGALERSYSERVRQTQTRRDNHAEKYPAFVDFRYLSLNSLLEPA